MIHITSFANPRMAQAFVDYMASQNIHLKMQPSQEQPLFELWLEDDQHLSQVRK
ncbi:rhomboid family intramembrane serine protease GlpG, partial [Providencia vermicola]|nr:rhomboid family intramembrane serine protease GlpG [Providencia vermicola]